MVLWFKQPKTLVVVELTAPWRDHSDEAHQSEVCTIDGRLRGEGLEDNAVSCWSRMHGFSCAVWKLFQSLGMTSSLRRAAIRQLAEAGSGEVIFAVVAMLDGVYWSNGQVFKTRDLARLARRKTDKTFVKILNVTKAEWQQSNQHPSEFSIYTEFCKGVYVQMCVRHFPALNFQMMFEIKVIWINLSNYY